VTDYRLDDRGSITGSNTEFSVILLKEVLRLSKPPILRVPQALSIGVRLPECNNSHPLPSSVTVSLPLAELYFHVPNTPTSWYSAYDWHFIYATRSWSRWENNVRMDLREIWWEGVDWMHMAQDNGGLLCTW